MTKLDVGALLTASADLTVTGDVTAKQNLSVLKDKTLNVGGSLDVSEGPYELNGQEVHSYIAGTLNVTGDAKVATAILPDTASLNIDGVLTITGQWFQYQGDSSNFNVDHIVMDHQPGRKNSAVLSLEGAGDYHLDKLELKNSTNETERYNGVQLHNANLSLNQMIVHENTVGMIEFRNVTYKKAEISTLAVAENGTFYVGSLSGSLSDQSQNRIVVENATFADNAKITRKDDYDEKEQVKNDGDVGLIFENLTAQGNLNISSMDSWKGGHGALTIKSLNAEGGAVTIDQQLQGSSAAINIAEGARVELNKGTNVDTLTVNMNTLAKDSLYVDSVGTNTKTNINVDGSLNDKDAASMIEELDSAVQIGKDDKGSYDFVIGEGAIFGQVTGNSGRVRARLKTRSWAGLAFLRRLLSALSLRHEMNSLSKRMGELRDAPPASARGFAPMVPKWNTASRT